MWKEQATMQDLGPFYGLTVYSVCLYLALGDQVMGDLRHTSGTLSASSKKTVNSVTDLPSNRLKNN